MILNIPANAILHPAGYGYPMDPNLMLEVGIDGLAGLGMSCSTDFFGVENCTPDSGPVVYTTQGNPGSGAGFDWNSLPQIINAAGNAASAALRAGQDPRLIPGTSTIYNPVSGTFATTSGVAAQAFGMSMLPMIGIAIVGLVVIVVAMKR
jgi:hypothetical protein